MLVKKSAAHYGASHYLAILKCYNSSSSGGKKGLPSRGTPLFWSYVFIVKAKIYFVVFSILSKRTKSTWSIVPIQVEPMRWFPVSTSGQLVVLRSKQPIHLISQIHKSPQMMQSSKFQNFLIDLFPFFCGSWLVPKSKNFINRSIVSNTNFIQKNKSYLFLLFVVLPTNYLCTVSWVQPSIHNTI